MQTVIYYCNKKYYYYSITCNSEALTSDHRIKIKLLI